MKKRCLHIGALKGGEGWETLNSLPLPGIDHVCDARDLSRFADGTFEYIYASHVLEHFDYRDEVLTVLREWHRVLAPGGALYISVPDLDTICRLYCDRDRLDVNDRWLLMRMLLGGHGDRYDYHKSAFNEEFLTYALTESGFTHFRRVDRFGLFIDTSSLCHKGELISLNLIAVKPEQAPVDAITVATSIAPRHIEKQIIAVDSWLALGFQVISVNHPAEIDQVAPLFPQVKFIPAGQVATELVGKPLVFLDDLLSALQDSGAGICGIINSDIVLQHMQGLSDFLENHCPGSFVYGPRCDVDTLQEPAGGLYQCGRDYFFFERSFIELVPASVLSIGAPWWDIWLPLVAEHAGKQLIQPLDRIALHVRHPVAWDPEAFWAMSTVFLNLISQHNLNIQKQLDYQAAFEQIFHHRRQNAMLTMLFSFLAEKTLIVPVTPTDTRRLSAHITLNPSAEYSLVFPCIDGRDVQFICDRILELELIAVSTSIEIIIIIEYWHDNHIVHDHLKGFADTYGNISIIRMMTRIDKRSVLDVAARFAHGATIIFMDSVVPYFTDDPNEMSALRNYYKEKFYSHLGFSGLSFTSESK